MQLSQVPACQQRGWQRDAAHKPFPLISVAQHCFYLLSMHITSGEAPLGEWEAYRVRPSFAGPVTAWEGAQAGAEDSGTAAGGGGSLLRSQRRLVLTARALLERRTDSYEASYPSTSSGQAVLNRLAEAELGTPADRSITAWLAWMPPMLTGMPCPPFMTCATCKCRWRCGTSSATSRLWSAMHGGPSGSASSGHMAGRRRCSSHRRAMLWRQRYWTQLRSGRPVSAAPSRTTQGASLASHREHAVKLILIRRASTPAVACLQVAAGRPIAVLPCPSATGSVIRSGNSGGSSAPVTIQVLQAFSEMEHVMAFTSVACPLHTCFLPHIYTSEQHRQKAQRAASHMSTVCLPFSQQTFAGATGSRAGADRPVSTGCCGA